MPTTLHVTNTAQKSLHKILSGLTLIRPIEDCKYIDLTEIHLRLFSGHACLYIEILNEALTVSILKNP